MYLLNLLIDIALVSFYARMTLIYKQLSLIYYSNNIEFEMVIKMITIRHLEKYYGSNHVLKDINLSIPSGSIFGILGKSGSGKSTLLRCINGLEKINSGSIIIDDSEISTMSPSLLRLTRKNIGMIFQNFSLIDRISVAENIALPMKVWGYDKSTINKKIDDLLDLVNLKDKKHVRARDLSGGQMQRVAIARALSTDPDIILSDESTSSLDPNSTDSIISLLKGINERYKKTIIVVTHEMEVVKSLCDYVAVIEKSEIKDVGSSEEIFFNQPQSLKNLIGKTKSYSSSPSKTIFHIKYLAHVHSSQFITQLFRELTINIDLIDYYSDNLKNTQINHFIISVSKNDELTLKQYLISKSVRFELLND